MAPGRIGSRPVTVTPGPRTARLAEEFGNDAEKLFAANSGPASNCENPQKFSLKKATACTIHKFTMTNVATPNNAVRVEQLQRAWAEILAEVLRRGFFGTAEVEVNVQDGTIQCIRRKIERLEK